MGEVTNTEEKASKKSWFKGLKSEFKKIIWPDKESLVKQSASVIVISLILGIIIKVLDVGIQYVINGLLQI